MIAAHTSPTTSHHALPRGPLARILVIVVVFAMGSALIVPVPAAAQLGAGGDVGGFVLDGDGAALADAEVVLKKRVNGSLWSYHETLSGSDGSFVFQDLEPGTWTLTGRLDGFRSNETTVTVETARDHKTNLTLLSLTDRRYTGTVLDQNETPIAGAIVTVRGYGQANVTERTTKSDGDGAFSIRLFSTENEITITRSGYNTYRDWVYGASGTIERTVYLYEVPPQSATVTGTVVDEDGNAVQAQVSLYPDRSYCCSPGEPEPLMATMATDGPMDVRGGYHYDNHNSTITGKDGSFQMDAYPGAVSVQANRAGYLVATEQVTLEDGKTSQITFTLTKLPERTVTISGTVTDKATGKAVQGASVNIQVPGAGDHSWTNTDADGRYTATVRPGYTLIEVNHWGYCCYEDVFYAAEDTGGADADSGTTKAVASDGEANESSMVAPDPHHGEPQKRYHPKSVVFTTQADDEKTLDVALDAKPEPGTTLVGYVLDSENGEPVTGASVSLQNHDTGEWGQAQTDENGSYKFTAYGGYHTVRIWVDGYLPYATNLALPGEGSKRADFEVTPGQYVNEGWWSPDDKDGYDDGPRPMPAYSEGSYDMASEDMAMGGRGAQASDGDARSAGERPDGPRSYDGGEGGLPAYDPDRKADTFGIGENAESPVSPLFGVVIALGLLAVAVGLRRERDD